MSWLSEMLKRVGIVPAYSEDDRMSAEAENALFDLERSKDAAAAEFEVLSEKSDKLRSVMSDARLQVSTLAQFEQRIRDLSKLRRTRN